MRGLFWGFVALALLAAPLLGDEAKSEVELAFELGEHPFSIELPYSKNVFGEEFATVVLRIHDPDLERIKLYTSTALRLELPVEANRSVICKSLRFRRGENFVTAIGYKMGQKVHKERVKFYVRDIRSKIFKYVPADYKKRPFHTAKGEARCAQCHDMSVNERPDEPFEDISKSHCYACHRVLLERKYAHAPVANFICTPCHSGEAPRSASASATRFPTPDPIGPRCLKCHEEKQKRWRTKSYRHDPAGAEKCTKCHNPHSSDVNKNFLRKPTWKLCTSCHADKSDKSAYIRLFEERAKRGEEIYGRLLANGFACTDCHDPHASDAPFLLREELEHNLSEVCFALSKGGTK